MTATLPRTRPSADRRRTALITGVAILLMAPFGMFGNIVVLGLGTEVAGMTGRVTEATDLIHLGVVAFLVVAILDVIVAWGITRFFDETADGLPRLAGWLRTAYAAVLVVAAGQLATATALAASGAAEDASVAAGVLGFTATWQLGLVVFAAHLALLATLIIRDAAAPTVIGWIIAVAAAAYACDSVARLFLPADSIVLAIVVVIVSASSVIGEVGAAIWLLARGGRTR